MTEVLTGRTGRAVAYTTARSAVRVRTREGAMEWPRFTTVWTCRSALPGAFVSGASASRTARETIATGDVDTGRARP